jgi:hypothetical protein
VIVGFVGRMGSGKTLSMTRELKKYKDRGYRVLTNYAVSFSDERIDFDKLFAIAEEQGDLNNVVLGLDEIHILLDSRSAVTTNNKVMTFWLNQTRKMSVKLFYTTQYAHQVDKRLRAGTDLFIYCNGVKVFKDGKEYFICHNEYETDERYFRDTFVGNDYYDYFDTRQVIMFRRGNVEAGNKL